MLKNEDNIKLESKESPESTFESTDLPSENDVLEISDHIKGLAKFLKECDTPTTISIQGEWGTGKTSIMKQVMNEVDEVDEGGVLNVWFDTWQFSQFSLDEQLPIILLNRLISIINTDGNFKVTEKDKGNKVKNTVESLNKIKNTLGTTANDIFKHKLGVDIYKTFKKEQNEEKIVSEKEEQKENIYDQIDNLKLDFEEWIEDLTQERIIIYIDDLDRLVPKKAVELLETLKIFLDVKKCVFVLAIDYDVVIRGVASKYGFDIKDPKELEKGKNFFDKIIQVPYSVPIDEYNFEDFIKKMLSNEKYNHDINAKNIEVLLINSVGKNPRSIKRILNVFKLQTIIKKDFDKDEILILFGFICMEQAYPHLYSYFIDKFQDNYSTYKDNEDVIKKITSEIIKDYKKDFNYPELAEELEKRDNEKFLEKLLEIAEGIKKESLAKIINASISTSAKRREKVKTQSNWDVFDNFDDFFKNHSEKSNKTSEESIKMKDSLEKTLDEISVLFEDLGEELKEEYKSNPTNIRSTISLKRGDNKSIADIQLQKNSITVECILGSKLNKDEIIKNTLDKYKLKLTANNRANFNIMDLKILEDSQKIKDFLSVVEIIIKNK